MNRVKSVLEEIRVDKQVKEYDTLESLLTAYINDGITHGRYYNVLVFGETLYIDKGNDNMGNLLYYQQAIRLTDDIYLLNRMPTDDHHYTAKVLHRVMEIHIRALFECIPLPTVHKKISTGMVHPSILRENIRNSTSKRLKKALKQYGYEHWQAGAIECLNRLQINTHRLRNPEQKNIDSATIAIIKESANELRHARKVTIMLDKYLDILKQLPEKPTP